MATWKIR